MVVIIILNIYQEFIYHFMQYFTIFQDFLEEILACIFIIIHKLIIFSQIKNPSYIILHNKENSLFAFYLQLLSLFIHYKFIYLIFIKNYILIILY